MIKNTCLVFASWWSQCRVNPFLASEKVFSNLIATNGHTRYPPWTDRTYCMCAVIYICLYGHFKTAGLWAWLFLSNGLWANGIFCSIATLKKKKNISFIPLDWRHIIQRAHIHMPSRVQDVANVLIRALCDFQNFYFGPKSGWSMGTSYERAVASGIIKKSIQLLLQDVDKHRFLPGWKPLL